MIKISCYFIIYTVVSYARTFNIRKSAFYEQIESGLFSE